MVTGFRIHKGVTAVLKWTVTSCREMSCISDITHLNVEILRSDWSLYIP